jgi:hypothetical protein
MRQELCHFCRQAARIGQQSKGILVCGVFGQHFIDIFRASSFFFLTDKFRDFDPGSRLLGVQGFWPLQPTESLPVFTGFLIE